jgi:hypothetical protein
VNNFRITLEVCSRPPGDCRLVHDPGPVAASPPAEGPALDRGDTVATALSGGLSGGVES